MGTVHGNVGSGELCCWVERVKHRPAGVRYKGAGLQINQNRAWGKPLLLAVALAFVVSRLVALWLNRDPWLDEAMLLANMPLHNPAALFRPLPLFEQASPLGYNAALSLLVGALSSEPVLAGRILSALASLTAGACLFFTVRRSFSPQVVALILVLAFLTPYAVRFGTEVKHYEFELLATTILMLSGHRFSASPNVRTLIAFAAACLLAILFSFTAPISIAACALGILPQAGFSLVRGQSKTFLRAMVAAGFVVVAAFGVYYFGYTKLVTVYQFSAYAYEYQPHLLDLPPKNANQLEEWLAFPAYLVQLFGLHQQTIGRMLPMPIRIAGGLVIFVLAAFGCLRLWKTHRFFAGAAVGAVVIVYAMAAARVIPFIYARHFLGLVPILAVALAVGVAGCVRFAFNEVNSSRVTAAIAVVVALAGMAAAFQLEESDIEAPIARYDREGRGDPLWVSPRLQPGVRVVHPETRHLGQLDLRSGATSWMERAGVGKGNDPSRYLASYDQALRQTPRLWLLTEQSRLHLPERAAKNGKKCSLRGRYVESRLYLCE